MRISQFATFLGEDMVFSSLTGGFGRLTDEGIRVIEAVKATGALPADANPDVVSEMIRGAILVDESVDEVASLDIRANVGRFDLSNIGLTIVPTLQCNFRCTYCFEQHHGSRMTDQVEEQIIGYVKARLPLAKRISISWYGGEPLLEVNRIESIQTRLAEISRENKLGFSSSMVTNGYLLTRDVAQKLKNLGIRSCQITLDGPREIHDSRRPLASQEGTYDRIIANVEAAADLLKISLRVNVDKTNLPAIRAWLPSIKNVLNHPSISLYFAPVRASTSVCAGVAGDCIAEIDFASTEISLGKLALELGISTIRYPRPLVPFCSAICASSVIVEPDGSLVKCWEHVGDPEARVGHIGDRLSGISYRLAQWLRMDNIPEGKCHECAVLPICMGGCPAHRMANSGPECLRYKKDLQPLLAAYAEGHRGKSASD